jgi:hypothetical protein
MLTALSFLAGVEFTQVGARTSAFPDRETASREEEWHYEPSIEELYSDGGGDA